MIEAEELESDKRRFPRIKARILYSPPRFYGPPKLYVQKRKISDISLGGVRIYSDEPLKKDKSLQLELELPSGKKVLATTRVAWIEELPPGSEGRYDVGLEFIYVPYDATNELDSLIENALSNE